MSNLLGIPETRLPADPAAAALAEGKDPWAVAAVYPASPLAWATLAEDALAHGHTIEGYAFARTGYHRSLDALRRGNGPRVLAFREGGSCRVGRQPGLGDAQEVAHQTWVPALRKFWQASTTRAAMFVSASLPQARGSYCFLLPTSPSIFRTPS